MKEKNKTNPILWFLFAIIIPFIVIGTLTIILLNVAGINVVDWAKTKSSNIPVISTLIKDDEEKEIEKTAEKTQEKIVNQKTEIDELNRDISDFEATIDQLEQDIIKLTNKDNSEANILLENEDEEISTVKTMASSFKKMNNKQAALIFQDLEEDIAISILKELSNDVRGGILEAMEPSSAVKLTQLFINSD